jgi:hypothetical protein
MDLPQAALYKVLTRAILQVSDACRFAERTAREGRRENWKG